MSLTAAQVNALRYEIVKSKIPDIAFEMVRANADFAHMTPAQVVKLYRATLDELFQQNDTLYKNQSS